MPMLSNRSTGGYNPGVPYNAGQRNYFEFGRGVPDPGYGAPQRMLLGGGMPGGIPAAVLGGGYGDGSYQPDYFSELGTLRAGNLTTGQANLDQYGQALTSGLDTYSASAGGEIDAYGSGLGALSDLYRTSTESSIAADNEARRLNRLNAGRGFRLGVRNAGNRGVRDYKAILGRAGGGGGSGGLRYLAGINAQAEADAANQMSSMERADLLSSQDARHRLNALLFDTGGRNAQNVFSSRLGLGGNVFNRRQNNLGTVYSEQSRLNTNDANMYRNDLNATRLITPTAGSLLPFPTRAALQPYLPTQSRLGRGRFGMGVF